MMGTGIPALDRGIPPARPAGTRGATAQGGGGFDDVVKSAARQPQRHSGSDTAGSSARASTQAAGDASGGATAAPSKDPSANADAARTHQPAAAEAREAPPAKDAGDDAGEDKEKKKKDAAGSAAGIALSLVLPGTPATPAKTEDAGPAAAGERAEGKAKAMTPPAAAGGGAAVRDALSGKAVAAGGAATAAAATVTKEHEPARRASSADGEKTASAAARRDGADGKTAPADGARIDPHSVRHAGGQDAAGSALAGLRARLSQAHTTADGASHRQALDVRSAAQAHQRQGLSASAAQAGSAKEAERSSHSDHAGAKAETVPASAVPATAAPAPQGGNAAALADAIAARPDWTQALAKSADVVSGAARPAHVSALRLQLNPADLGVVTATLRVTGNQLVISLQVHTAEAYRQLSTGNEAILDKLKGHGYAVENITVQHVAIAGSAASQQPQAQQPGFASQQGGHQAAAGGGQQSSGHGQGQGSGGRSGFFDQAQPRPDESVGVGGVRGRASGGLYV